MAVVPLDQGLQVLGKRSVVVTWAIYAYVASSFVALLINFGIVGGSVDFHHPSQLNMASTISAYLILTLWIVSFFATVVIAMWIFRAHANLRAAGVKGLKFSPGWAVGWYFIPIANCIQPLYAMRELLRVSDPKALQAMREPPELMPWWICFVVSNIVSTIAASRLIPAPTAGLLSAISIALSIAAAWCLLRLVRIVTGAQTDRLFMRDTFA